MKRVIYLKKSSLANSSIIADPSVYVGKEYVFDDYYLIKILSVNKSYFIFMLEIEGSEHIDKIAISEFLKHIKKGTMIEKTVIESFDFNDYSEYYQLASSFLLINYNILIDNITFDWESEFKKFTPIEVACKLALGIFKK